MGIARQTAAEENSGHFVSGLPGVGRHRPLRVDVRGLQILAGEIRHRRPVRHVRAGRAAQARRVVPAVPQAPQPGRPASGRRIETVTLAEANAHGQQLFIAGTWRPAGTPPREYVKKTIPADMSLLRPVAHRQLVLFDMPRDLRLGLWEVPAATGPRVGSRVRPVRPRPRRRSRLGQELHRHHPTRHPDHARHPGHPRRTHPPQRHHAADPHQALGRHSDRGSRRGRNARRRHRTRGGALVQRQDRRTARADVPRTGRLAGRDVQRQHHPAPLQAAF